MKRFYRKNAKKSLRRGKAPRSSKKSSVSAKLRTKKFNKLRKTAKVKVSVPPQQVRETNFSTKGKRRKYIRGATNLSTHAPIGMVISGDSGKQAYSWIDMCRRSQLTSALVGTGSDPTNLTGAIADTYNIHWRSAKSTVLITNSTNAISNVTLFHYVYKRDTSINVGDLWLRGAKDAQGNTVDNTVIYGVQPNISPMVNQYLKLKKTYDYTMAPGSTLKHVWYEAMNRTINNEVLSTDGSPNNYFAGLSQVMLILVKGYPGTDATSTVVTLANTTPTQLDIVYTQEYRYTYVTDNTPNVTVNAGSGTGTQGGNVKIYDENGNSTTDAEIAKAIIATT